MQKIFVFALFILILCLKNTHASDDQTIAPKWQKTCLEHFRASESQEAWGLFSYSGWADAGQRCIIGEQLYWVEEGTRPGTKMSKTRLSKQQTISFINKSSTWRKVQNLETQSFDGIQFQYIHWKKTNNQINLIHKIFMSNPQQEPWSHIVLSFQEFTKKG